LHVERRRFASDIDALRAELDAELSPADSRHLLKIAGWGRALCVFGLATCWLAPNPLAVIALSFGAFVRWAVVAHHTLHGGYDQTPEVPRRYTSRRFASGWRRAIDWLDWLDPEAWRHEHNLLHHCRLNETPGDPDLVEALVEWHGPWPRPVRLLLLVFYAFTWKAVYYGPNLQRLHGNARARRVDPAARPVAGGTLGVVSPLTRCGRQVWLRCWLPYALWRFGFLPAMFLPLGEWAWASALINLAAAELLTNAHAFLMVLPNHAGSDLWRFDGPVKGGKGEFYVRQIVGSANYRCGGELTDLLHGWLNYQIEHHVWPDLTLLQYRRAQPRLKALCERYGVLYAQESVFWRFRKMVAIAVGRSRMQRTGNPLTP
jgi:fatty acid desaturase